MSSYQHALDFLYSKLPMFSRIGSAAYKKDLTNTVAMLSAFENPHAKFKSIHVGGTNGKGSVSHMLASVLQAAGYKTGLYTSPHLRDFRERIKIDGEPISEDQVVDEVERLKPLISETNPSFFEVTVVMAFHHFALSSVDIAVIEVGLGGRLDSTNVIRPELSVITNVGWDHMNLLGDTLEKIAVEKAGIIKQGVPVVIGEASLQTDNVFKQIARERDSPIFFAEDRQYVCDWKYSHHDLVVEVADKKHDDRIKYHLDLTGFYQTKNLITTLESIRVLKDKGWNITHQHVQQGLQRVRKSTGLHGRWEVIRQQPLVALDVGHNIDGIKQILAQIEITEYNDLHMVVGFVKEKEIQKMLSILPREATYYFTKANIPRAISEIELARAAADFGLTGECYPDVNAASQAALAKAGTHDLIVVFGSVFLVGELDNDKLKLSVANRSFH